MAATTSTESVDNSLAAQPKPTRAHRLAGVARHERVLRTNRKSAQLAPIVLRRRLMAADAAAVLLGFTIAFGVQWVLRPTSSPGVSHHLVLAAVSLPGFALGAALNHLYRTRANATRIDEAANILRMTAVGIGLMVLLAFAVQMKDLSRFWVLLVAICIPVTVISERELARRLFAQLRATGRIRRRIAIVGTDPHAIGLLHMFQRDKSLGYEVVGFVGEDDLGRREGVRVLGSLVDLDAILQRYDVGGVVVSPASVPDKEINVLTRRLTDTGYHVAISTALSDIDISRLRPQSVDGRSMIYVEPVVRGGMHHAAKRAFDISTAVCLLVLTSPVLLASAIAIKVSSRGPILFRQTRVGKDGELFTMVKLRTMVVDAEARRSELEALNEADGPLFKITRDPRITKVGRVLRKLSIDELPQLVAVVRGTMSMVGPRPALPDEVERWDATTKERLRVLPGLTGLWQVSGRSDSSFEQYKRLDLYYVDNWSLRHDLMICARTIVVVLAGTGAS